MYCDGLGFSKLGGFADHEGYYGAMLGRSGASYHLEFTERKGETVPGAPTRENLLVFYIPEESDWLEACDRAAAAGFSRVESENPYWDRCGRTFEDPEGYRIVFENEAWTRD